jgi:hypothetical protein
VSLLAIVFFRGEAPSPPSAAAELKLRVSQLKGQGLTPLAFALSVFGATKQKLSAADPTGDLGTPLTETPTTSASGTHQHQQQQQQLQSLAAESPTDPSDVWRMDSYQKGGFFPEESAVEEVDLEDDEDGQELLNDVTVHFHNKQSLSRLLFPVRGPGLPDVLGMGMGDWVRWRGGRARTGATCGSCYATAISCCSSSPLASLWARSIASSSSSAISHLKAAYPLPPPQYLLSE